jgi:hypothetical protein
MELLEKVEMDEKDYLSQFLDILPTMEEVELDLVMLEMAPVPREYQV